ncbi:MAG: UDP-N-acetylmuramoyl-L-alanine--D-glutamate ligase [Nitrospinae bacterium]|nr:UDP-N-acetylmuramoyl-L-alanine--D-glutamate ligase [Nitrospinota bacterium]
MKDYAGRNALVIGLARSGLAAARLLHSLGARVTVTDTKSEEQLGAIVRQLPVRVERFLGGHGAVRLADFDLAVISSGVPWDAPFPRAVREAGIEMISEIELAFTRLSAPVIAVTGSNGKSTTTTLIGEILKAAGRNVFVGGNLGAPLCDAAGGDYEWIAAEVSSFQLEGIKTFRPRVALILNITPDHMDRHGGMENYAALKARVAGNMGEGDTLILNAGDPLTRGLGGGRARVWWFGQSAPHGEGAWAGADGVASIRAGGLAGALFGPADVRIKGRHNVENAMAAALACVAAGAPLSAIKQALASFGGLPHRMELVAAIDGVAFINDSKATNPEAAIKSLEGFDRDVTLIAGGSDKGLAFGALAEVIRRKAKGVVLIGETAPLIEEALGDFQPRARVSTLDEAVALAAGWSAAGDTVLLAPACASFDMFNNYEHRGAMFREAVARLAREREKCR